MSPKQKLSGAAKGWIITGATAVVLAGGYVGGAYALAGTVPHGTTVHGVEVGGQQRQEALLTLDAALTPVAERPVTLTAGESTVEIAPEEAGLRLDLEATVSQYTGFTLDPTVLWRHIVGGGEIAPVTAIDKPALTAALADAAKDLNREPVEGKLAFDGAKPVITEPVEGLQVAQDAATGTVAERWFDAAAPIELPTVPTQPQVVGSAFEAAAKDLAEPLVAGPITVAAGDLNASLSPEALAAAASFSSESGSVQMVLDPEKLLESIKAANPELATEATDASVALGRSGPQVIAHKPGREVSTEGLSEKIIAASTTSERTVTTELTETEPEFTTADAQALGIKDVIVDFSTPYPKYDTVRTKNLVAGAQKLTGVIVKPGETFSLLEVLSPITKANGYFESGVVESGFSTTALGGGLSQISTQMFNVGWLAGYDDVAHQPHSRWFDRYPAGREATVWEGQIDMKWKNNTPYGVLIQAWVSDSAVHTRLWSTKYWTVSTSVGPKTDIKKPETKYNEAEDCEPESGGKDGFTITNSRTRTSADQSLGTETLRWTYQPWHKVVCGPKPKD